MARGVAFSDVPVRINCLPELTLLTLRHAPTGGGREVASVSR